MEFHSRRAMGLHPPTQEATAVKLWRNAQWVSSEALAIEDTLWRVLPKTQKGPRLPVLRSSPLRRVDQVVGLHYGARCRKPAIRFNLG
jgi:hypothetical protein